MSALYIDESVHERDGFIVAACVFAQIDLNDQIAEAIALIDEDPTVFEYKSGMRYDGNLRQAELRLHMRNLLYKNCRASLVILPAGLRDQLAFVALNAAKQFIGLNGLDDLTDIYLDEGMVKMNPKTAKVSTCFAAENIVVHFEQDSRVVRPLQLADLVAHVAAIQIKLAIHQTDKMVKIDETGEEMELSFELFKVLRYIFYHEPPEICDEEFNQFKHAYVNLGAHGLYIADGCPADLKELVTRIYSTVYLGCTL